MSVPVSMSTPMTMVMSVPMPTYVTMPSRCEEYSGWCKCLYVYLLMPTPMTMSMS